MKRLFAICLFIAGGLFTGCEAYDVYSKNVTRAVSPEYRAYETQQQQLSAEQKAARDKEARKQLCAQSGC